MNILQEVLYFSPRNGLWSLPALWTRKESLLCQQDCLGAFMYGRVFGPHTLGLEKQTHTNPA